MYACIICISHFHCLNLMLDAECPPASRFARRQGKPSGHTSTYTHFVIYYSCMTNKSFYPFYYIVHRPRIIIIIAHVRILSCIIHV